MTEARAMKPRLTSAFKLLMSVHWWMAGIYIPLFIVGTYMSQLERGAPWRNELYDFHKSLGVLSMALLTWRILLLLKISWQKYTRRLPKFTPTWLRNVSLHLVLYLFMWAVPIAGFLLSNSFRPNNVKLFGLVLPDIFPPDRAMVDVGRTLHFWLSYTFLAFIILHAIAQWKVVRANWRRLQNFIPKLLRL
jgi:cytochrome b561